MQCGRGLFSFGIACLPQPAKPKVSYNAVLQQCEADVEGLPWRHSCQLLEAAPKARIAPDAAWLLEAARDPKVKKKTLILYGYACTYTNMIKYV